MHELAITQSLVDVVAERTAGRRVRAVHVRVGQLCGVVPDSMEFCFDLAVAGTPLEGARLVIEQVPGRIRCRACGTQQDVADLLLLCACGSADVEPVAGHELQLCSVEVERATSCA